MTDRVITGRLGRLSRLAGMAPRAGLALARGVTGMDAEGAQLGSVLSDTLGKLKGGSMKLGQLLAQVGDDMPAGARLRLGELYAGAPPLSPDAVIGLLEAELGAPVDRLYARFERQPFAAASLGQVHAAWLEDGTALAVKIQYPGVEEALAHDLELLAGAVGTASLGGALLDARGWLVALRESVLGELDLGAEAARLERMAGALEGWPDLVIPGVLRQRSSRRVLTMDRLEGPTLHAWMEHPPDPRRRAALGRQALRAIVGPALRSGLINADAHPGNFIVMSEGRLGLIDFGAVSELPQPRRTGLIALVAALMAPARPSAERITGLLRGAGMGLELPAARAERFAGEIFEILRPGFQGAHDFERDSLMTPLGRLKQQRPLDTLGARPTPDVLPLLRALVGVHHALRRLGVPIDVRAELSAILAPST